MQDHFVATKPLEEPAAIGMHTGTTDVHAPYTEWMQGKPPSASNPAFYRVLSRNTFPFLIGTAPAIGSHRYESRTSRWGGFEFSVLKKGCVQSAINGETMFLKLIGGFFVCLWAADFVTGLAHWLEDTYCLENYPLIGSFICEPNIEHHIDPQLMVREGTFFSRNLLQWTLCGGVYALLWLVGLGGIFTFTILLMASFGNEIHRWNHMSKTSGFVTFMKDTGLIQIQKQHSLHHKQPHNQYYCVMTSLLNAVLERVNFWRKLEWVVQATTGIAPKRENRRDSKSLKKKKTAKPKVAKTTSTKTTAPEVKAKETESDNQLVSTLSLIHI